MPENGEPQTQPAAEALLVSAGGTPEAIPDPSAVGRSPGQAAGEGFPPPGTGNPALPPTVPAGAAPRPGGVGRPAPPTGPGALGGAMRALALRLPEEAGIARWAVPAVLLTLALAALQPAADGGLAWLWALIALAAWTMRWHAGDDPRCSLAIAAAGYWSALGLAVATGLHALIAVPLAVLLGTTALPGKAWITQWPQWHAALLRSAGGALARGAGVRLPVLCAAGAAGLLLVAASGLDRSHGVAFALLAFLAWVGVMLTATGPISAGSRGIGRAAFLLCVWAWGDIPSLLWPLAFLMLGLTVAAALQPPEAGSAAGGGAA